jgi:hypothetical protein
MMARASESEVLVTASESEELGPVFNMIGDIPAKMNTLQRELINVVGRSNLKITQLSFSISTKTGYLSFKMPGKCQEDAGGDGFFGGSNGPGYGISRRNRRERMKAERATKSNKDTISSVSEEEATSSGYSSEENYKTKEELMESYEIHEDILVIENDALKNEIDDNLVNKSQEVIKDINSEIGCSAIQTFRHS